MRDLSELDRLARPGAFSTLDMAVLVPEVERLEPGQIYVEIGVDKGKSLSVARMVAKDGVHIIGVDLAPDPEVPGTDFARGDSRDPDTASGVIEMYERSIDVLFIDGDHSYEGCKADIENWYPWMSYQGVMLFHDCDATSPGVVRAVREFVESHKVKEIYYDPDQRCSMARIRL